MRKLGVLLLVALAALPFAQLKAGNDAVCGGFSCPITINGYEVRADCKYSNLYYGYVQFFGDYADDPNGNWKIAFLPAEKMQDMDYYAVATFWHNYTVKGTWSPRGYVESYIIWDRWESGSVAYSDGTITVRVEYPQFGWTWQTGRPGGTVKHYPPSDPQKPGGTDWKDSASGPAKSFPSNTVVEGSGRIEGWLGYTVWRGKVRGAWLLGGELYVPQPPKPDTLSIWAKDVDTGRVIMNATVNSCWYDWYWYNYYCANGLTPFGRKGSRFKLTAYNSSDLWLARTDVGWYYIRCYPCTQVPLGQDPLLPGRYPFSGALTYTSQPLTGALLVKLYVAGSYARVYLQVEDPPGSGSYKTVAQGTLPDYGGGWGYSGVLQLNSQRLRLTFSSTSQFHPPSASGWIVVADPLQGPARPAGWEVYKGSDLIIKTSSATVGEFGSGDGSDYLAIALYNATQLYKLTVRLVKPDGTPAYGAWVKLDNASYTDCADGKCDGAVAVSVSAGPHTVEVLDTYYNKTVAEKNLWNATSPAFDPRTHWQRYTFWKWSDGDASNPRTVTVSNDTTLVAYVWDEKRLWILYEPHYGSDPWGVKAVSLPSRYSSYVGQMLPWNASFWLRPGESFTLQAVEGGAARFLRWEIATECYPRNPYSVDPVITRTIGSYGTAVRAVFRLGPSNQTLYLPGEGIPVPIFWPVYQQYAMGGCDGRKGTWLLNVSAVHAAAQNAFAGDNRTWIYALLVNSSSILDSVWVPVNGSWRLYMDKDWNAVAHKLDDCSLDNPYADACRYVAYDNSSISDFPQVVSGTPSKYRGWRLIGLAAWKPLLPGESYSSGAINAVWLDDNSTTYALYNVTFKHVDSGWVYWQPVAVSTLKIESAVARYKLSSYDSQLRRSPIYMWIEAVVNWTYVPPNVTLPTLPPNVTLWMVGFKPHRIGNVGVALESDAGVVVWAPRGSAYGTTGKLYTLSIGDTELFYREPKGLNFGKRDFKLVARFVARAGQPGVKVGDGLRDEDRAELGFTLAPATAVIAGFANNDPSRLVVDWDCFRSGREPFGTSRMGVNYQADLYYEWGPVDPYNGTLPPLDRRALTGNPPLHNIPPVDPDYWVAFYPIPTGNQYTVERGITVPVPLPAKYPPRAKGG
jgi:hypothetical protein